jgi:hypothetical protein
MVKKQPNHLLETFFLIASFFPFVSFYPIGADIQPIAGILAFIVIFKNVIYKEKKMDKGSFYMLVISFCALFYIDPLKGGLDIRLGSVMSLFYGSLVYAAFYLSKRHLTLALFSNIIRVYFGLSILLIVDFDTFTSLQGYIVRNVNSDGISGARGILTLSTEPGLFGGMLVAFLIVNDYLFANNVRNKNIYYGNFAMILLMIIATKSGTGYMLFGFYLMILVFFKKINWVIFFSSLLLLLLLQSVDISTFRGTQIITQLFQDPAGIIKEDMSVLTRLFSLYFGVVSVFYYPLGVGINNINTDMWIIIESNNFLNSFPKNINLSNTDSISLTSSFSTLTLMYGVMWWIFLYLIFFRFSNAQLIAKVFAMIFLMFSYSAAFPLIWILLNLKSAEGGFNAK